jgi:hypothetical protein
MIDLRWTVPVSRVTTEPDITRTIIVVKGVTMSVRVPRVSLVTQRVIPRTALNMLIRGRGYDRQRGF